jgi:hypothetical protein
MEEKQEFWKARSEQDSEDSHTTLYICHRFGKLTKE